MSRYLKSITALFTGVVGWGAFVVASPSAAVTAPEWIMLAVAVGTALGVYAIPNQSPPKYALTSGVLTLGQAAQAEGISGTGFVKGGPVPTSTTTTIYPEPAAKPPPPVKPVKKAPVKKAAAKKAKP